MKKLLILCLAVGMILFAGNAMAGYYIYYDLRVPPNVGVAGDTLIDPDFQHQSWQGDIGGGLQALAGSGFVAEGYNWAEGGADAFGNLKGFSYQIGNDFAFAMNIGCITADAYAIGNLGSADVYAFGMIEQYQGGQISGYHGFAGGGNYSFAAFGSSDEDIADALYYCGRCWSGWIYFDPVADAYTGGFAKVAGVTILDRDFGFNWCEGYWHTSDAFTGSMAIAGGTDFAEVFGAGEVGAVAQMGPAAAGGMAYYSFSDYAPYGGIAAGAGYANVGTKVTVKYSPNGIKTTASVNAQAFSTGGYAPGNVD